MDPGGSRSGPPLRRLDLMTGGSVIAAGIRQTQEASSGRGVLQMIPLAAQCFHCFHIPTDGTVRGLWRPPRPRPFRQDPRLDRKSVV